MTWLRKDHAASDQEQQLQAPFIIGSDKWMGSSARNPYQIIEPLAQRKSTGGGAAAGGYIAPPRADHISESLMSHSMDHSRRAPQIFRTYSQNSRRAEAPRPDMGTETGGVSLYPQLFHTNSNTYDFNAVTSTAVDADNIDVVDGEHVEASEDVLVRISGAMVHLIDDEESPLLGSGDFSVVRIEQQGNGIVVVVKVGDSLQWPLTKDERAVKLDPTHYFFTLRVPRRVEEMDGDTAKENGPSVDSLSYGVTFSLGGHQKELHELDALLERYSSFSSPTLVHGDKEREQLTSAGGNGSGKLGAVVIPKEVVSSDGKKITTANQSEFWTTMAPNVDDYNSNLAKSMAKGTGHIIRTIFWVRDSTVAQLESGNLYMKSKVKSNSKPSKISPRTLHNIQRARNMTIATENVAKSILDGVVKTAGFFSGAMMKSKAGKKFFRLLPGEVALVSMDAFAKIFDALERAGTDIMQSTSMYTQDIVVHRFGPEAGQVAEETMSTAGHVFATAWTVSKVRRALNPSKFRPSKTAMLKVAAKAAVGGRSK